MDKQISSGSPYEKSIGFSRAVRRGNQITVSGTAPILPGGETAYPGDPYEQTRQCLKIIQEAIEASGGQLENVVRTRIMLKNISDWEAAGKAHGDFFSQIKPASTMIAVDQLIRPDWLVEIEADCIVPDSDD